MAAEAGCTTQPEHIRRSLDHVEERTLRYEVERLRREVNRQELELKGLRADIAAQNRRISGLTKQVFATNESVARGWEE